MTDNGSFDPLPPNTQKPWHHVSEYDAIEWGELDGARLQIMRQAALFGLLGVAWHCIMHHEPMISMEGNTLHIYAMADERSCGLYTKIDFHFKENEAEQEPMNLGPSNVFNWVMTAIMDPDNSKQMNYPAVIEGNRIRVEIG